MADEGHAKMIVLVWLPSARAPRPPRVGDKEGAAEPDQIDTKNVLILPPFILTQTSYPNPNLSGQERGGFACVTVFFIVG